MNRTPDLELAWEGLPRAHGEWVAEGIIRAQPEDFWVDEVCNFTPDGSGEHLLVRVEKRNTNTEWVARRMTEVWGVAPAGISYAGLKDRRAVTRQWFSLHLPGQPDPDPTLLEDEAIRVLEVVRHGRKLRRGALRENGFRIILRELHGEPQQVEERLHQLQRLGVPNFFGNQRFGRNGSNLEGAARLFGGARRRLSRHQRGLLLSAARSFLFNRVAARRVELGNWNQWLEGDLMMLDGRGALFAAEPGDAAIAQRLLAQEIHPSGPLWGAGVQALSGAAAELEQQVLGEWPEWGAELARLGLRHERRALRLRLDRLCWRWLEEGALELSFPLPAGSYATALLRELVVVREPVDGDD